MTPDSGPEKVEKPAQHTVCPEGNHPLRLKQLRPVRFTAADNGTAAAAAAAAAGSGAVTKTDEKKAGGGGGGSTQVSGSKGRFMCPSCRRGLSNVVKTCFISPCGHVICTHCVDTFVRKDKSCTQCGAKLNAPDTEIIAMAFGGTGFAAHGSTTITRKDAPSFLSG